MRRTEYQNLKEHTGSFKDYCQGEVDFRSAALFAPTAERSVGEHTSEYLLGPWIVIRSVGLGTWLAPPDARV